MNREEAKEYIKNQLESYLQSKGIDTRKPFRCLNPNHNDNNPSMSIDKAARQAHCFSCGAKYDTLDIIGLDFGLTDYNAQLAKAAEIFGITIDGSYKPLDTQSRTTPTTAAPKEAAQSKDAPDFTEIVEAAHSTLLNSSKPLDYLKERGISAETIATYKLGYDAQGYNHFLQAYPDYQSKKYKSNLYRLIFPFWNDTGRAEYFLMEIADRKQIDKYNGKYEKIAGLTAPLFNERYIKANTPPAIFINEGIYDALSVEEAGGKAIALCGTAHGRLIALCKKYKPDTVFILALDNDDAGRAATEKIAGELDALHIPYIVKTPTGGKDFNDALVADKESFHDFIQQAIDDAKQARNAEREQQRQELEKESAFYSLQGFIDDITESKTASYYPTGFSNLDVALDGGLYAGLYIVGAISSLGKTSFCLQIAEQIAAAGNDVLIFSLEMARNELIAKGISRLTLMLDMQQNSTTANAKTTRGILTGSRYAYYSATEKALIKDAIEAYRKYAAHIYINEGIGNIGIEQIRERLERHYKATGKAPIVLIDYLQILAPSDIRASDKQNTDKAVLELKRMSRDYKTPIIAISSFNRENYSEPVSLAAFKESGAIEYGSDVLIGLQYSGADYQDGEKEPDRKRRIRELLQLNIEAGKQGQAQHLQAKILKNRNGSKGETRIDFYPMFNYFTESISAPTRRREDIDALEQSYGKRRGGNK